MGKLARSALRLWALWAFAALLVVAASLRDQPAHAWPPTTSGTDSWHLIAQNNAFNPNWSIATWYFDPQNSTGLASDGNTCTSASAPCLTWSEINDHRWGCVGSPRGCPHLTQTTTVNQLSSHPNTSDPIIVYPALLGASLFFVGPLGAAQQVATGTTSGTVAKARTSGAPQLLNVTLPAGLALGELVQNTTHASFAWLYQNTSGNAWNMAQPLAAVTPPIAAVLAPPAEVNTWANGDAVTVWQPVVINAVDVEPIVADLSASFNNGVYFQHLTIDAPGDTFPAPVTFGENVSLIESASRRMVNWRTSASTGAYFPQAINGYAKRGYTSNVGSSDPAIAIVAGVVGEFNSTATINGMGNFQFDGDVIFGGPSTLYNTGNQFGLVYIDTGATVLCTPESGRTLVVDSGGMYGSAIVWGPGTFNTTVHVQYNAGAGKAATTFTVTNLRVNFQTKACIAQPGAAAIGACNTTLTAANLDTNAGATSGCLTVLGGGAFCNF